MSEVLKLVTRTTAGKLVKVPTIIERKDDRIYFLKSPFALKNEIKAMKGSIWHGKKKDDGRQIWSIEDCTRNNFQLDFMQGGNPYENWDQPLKNFSYTRPLYDHQKLMSDHVLTYHYKILAAEMGTGKTLSAIEVMERSGELDWWWVGPKSGLAAVEREFEKWGLTVQPKTMTYERLRIIMETWEPGQPAPAGVIFDESSRLKSWRAQRTKAAMHLADAVRKEHGWGGYVVLMTGTPAPKSPVDWWSQCEVCYPGFVKEGSAKAFEWRLGIFKMQKTDGGNFYKRLSWRDDENKCDDCGKFADDEIHDPNNVFDEGVHEYIPSKNEALYLSERLDGLVLPLAKKDCLQLPEKIYRSVVLEPSSTIKRVARALGKSALSAVQGLTWLRELSDGFQYRDKQCERTPFKPCPVCKGEGEYERWFIDGQPSSAPINDEEWEGYEKKMAVCDRCDGSGQIEHIIREAKEVPCPKDQAIRELLEENEDQGRIVIFAGFQGSVDRIVKLCHKQQWNVVKVDGRGWITKPCNDEKASKSDPKAALAYWADLDNERVAFVAHPESGGMGLTLTESRMAVFYSNDFKPESRIQGEDRIHRPGMDENKGATIVDLFHLGTDTRVLNVLKDNRRIEKMTLGEFKEICDDL
jgi:SNF2 family DNA or RNA helicase